VDAVGSDQVSRGPSIPIDRGVAPADRRTAAEGATGLLRRWGEDLRFAWRDFVFSGLGGSKWLPRTVRRGIFTMAGASVKSAPGAAFRFAGRPRNLTLGSSVYMNQSVFIEAIAPVTIGDDTAVGMEAMVLTSHHPLDDAGAWQVKAQGREVVIGDRVWIGARAIVLPGAVIESDVVIAAGAVVTGRCVAQGVYAGVPARRIRDYSSR